MSLKEKNTKTRNWFTSDLHFNELYPITMQVLAKKHYTPLSVAKKAAAFLATDNDTKILDIGSGVGKFCLAAAYYEPNATYFGIEQRGNLIKYAETAKEILQVNNVSFINGNFTQIDFKKYDHFYFFNSFYENLIGTSKIDNNIDYSRELYNYYNAYLYMQLQLKPAGTKLATYHSLEGEIPKNYHVVGSEMDNLLKFWIKI